jgi:hypothetical protein
MRKTKPNCNALAGKSICKIFCDGFAEPTGDVCPVHTCHEGGYQYSTRVDDIACGVLVIAIVGARIDIGTCDLRVHVVAIDRDN